MKTKIEINKKEIDESTRQKLEKFRASVLSFFNEKELEMLRLIGLGVDENHLWNWSRLKFSLDEDKGPNYQQSLQGFGSVVGWKFISLTLLTVLGFIIFGVLIHSNVWYSPGSEVVWYKSFWFYSFLVFAGLNVYLLDKVIPEKRFYKIRFVYHLRHLTCRLDSWDDFKDVKVNKSQILALYDSYLKENNKDIFLSIDEKMDKFVLIKENDKCLALAGKLKMLKRENLYLDIGLVKRFSFNLGVRKIHEEWINNLWERREK